MKVPYIRAYEPNSSFVHTCSVKQILNDLSLKEIQDGIDYLVSLTNGQINNIDKHDLESLGIVHFQKMGRVGYCEQEALAVLHRLMLAKKKIKG
jgi:hypothetical protein